MKRHLIACLAVAACALPAWACSPWIEEYASGHAVLRAHADALQECTLDEMGYQRLVAGWLRGRPHEAGKITSIGLGRAVTYPWLSRHIADAALRQPAHVKGDALAAAVLQDPVLLQRLALPFAATRYEAEKLSYEKVLFGRADRYSSDKNAGSRPLPFDAQLWLQLKPRR